jgi:purine nucleosidase
MTETTAIENFADLWQAAITRHRRVERWRAVKFRSALGDAAATITLVGYATTRPGTVADTAAANRSTLNLSAVASPPTDSLRTLARLPAVPVIFDTDMGNSIDDSLALAMLHGYQAKGTVDLLAVTLNYDSPDLAAYVDAIDTYYGWGDTPIGMVDGNGVTDGRDAFHRQVGTEFPHDLTTVEGAVSQIRRALASQPDGSVVVIATGFSTNLAQLLASSADESSPLDGRALVAAKVKLLAITAGDFLRAKPEINTARDPLSARILFDQWPTPIVVSEWHVGAGLPFPGQSLADQDDNPVLAAADLYGANALRVPFPYDPPSFDLTTVLYAVEPDAFFSVGEPGRVTLDDQLIANFQPDPSGHHRLIQGPTEPGTRDRITARFAELVNTET